MIRLATKTIGKKIQRNTIELKTMQGSSLLQTAGKIRPLPAGRQAANEG